MPGVFPVGHKSTQEFIHSLASWAHSNKNTHQCMLLLVDDLESVASLDLEAVQDFRWLLLRGPARRVWPIVTLNAPRYGQVISWLQNFRTRIFGHIANGRVAEALGGDKASGLDQLEAADSVFPAREGELASLLAAELLASPSLLCYNRIVGCIDEWWSDNQREFLASWHLGVCDRWESCTLDPFCRGRSFTLTAHTQEKSIAMEAKLYVGNLPYTTVDADLRELCFHRRAQ